MPELKLPPRDKKRRQSVNAVPISKNIQKFVVIGGGISGISCAEEIARHVEISDILEVILISASNILKQVSSNVMVTNHIQDIKIFEVSSTSYAQLNSKIKIVEGEVNYIDFFNKKVYLLCGQFFEYTKLSICSGSRPKLLMYNHPRVIALRDLESVEDLANRIESGKNIAVVGNGGIALELIHTLKFCNIDWIIKDDFIGNSFFDSDASNFFLPNLADRLNTEKIEHHNNENFKFDKSFNSSSYKSSSVGPDWSIKFNFDALLSDGLKSRLGYLKIHFKQFVIKLKCNDSSNMEVLVSEKSYLNSSNFDFPAELDHTFPMSLMTNNGNIIGFDFLISAIGVLPCTVFLQKDLTSKIKLSDDGFIVVDSCMKTSIENVYAAGDCCIYSPKNGLEDNWFQKRLWSQAKNMGQLAAISMLNIREQVFEANIFLEIFTHLTYFFGYKVIFLGRYNCQGFSNDIKRVIRECNFEDNSNKFIPHNVDKESDFIEIFIRKTSDQYIKVVVNKSIIIGALLIGQTDLEETFENLILNKTNISQLGMNILNPRLDLEDYFD